MSKDCHLSSSEVQVFNHINTDTAINWQLIWEVHLYEKHRIVKLFHF